MLDCQVKKILCDLITSTLSSVQLQKNIYWVTTLRIQFTPSNHVEETVEESSIVFFTGNLPWGKIHHTCKFKCPLVKPSTSEVYLGHKCIVWQKLLQETAQVHLMRHMLHNQSYSTLLGHRNNSCLLSLCTSTTFSFIVDISTPLRLIRSGRYTAAVLPHMCKWIVDKFETRNLWKVTYLCIVFNWINTVFCT